MTCRRGLRDDGDRVQRVLTERLVDVASRSFAFERYPVSSTSMCTSAEERSEVSAKLASISAFTRYDATSPERRYDSRASSTFANAAEFRDQLGKLGTQRGGRIFTVRQALLERAQLLRRLFQSQW